MVEVSKSSNPHMQRSKLDVGVINSPYKLNSPELYNPNEATQTVRMVDTYISHKRKERKFIDKHKTPTGILVLLGATLTGILAFKFKLGSKLKSLINHLRKR